ncbi:MAG: hypothetical protein FWG10_09535 [Eubacteriaceae bacterium]|nr:hypothetical protein [Eubacteriaceae bacterium]
MKKITSRINIETATLRAKFITEHAPGSYTGKVSTDSTVMLTIHPNGDMTIVRDNNPDKITYGKNGLVKYVETVK